MGLDDLVDLENIPIEQVFENLKCNKEGLTYTDVEERLSIYGHNKLEEKMESKFLNFLRYSWNPLSRTMVAAAIMAIVLANGGGRPPDWQLFLGIVTFLIEFPSDIEHRVHSAMDIFAEKVLHSIAEQANPSDIELSVHSVIDMKVLHSIAEAYQEVPHGAKEKSGSPWQFIGLLPFVDPPREDCASSIRELLNHGVSVKMIARDQLVIGKEIGRRLGMGTNMYPSSALLGHNDKSIAADNDLSIDEIIEKADGFVSCALPEQKYEIIKHLRSRKHIAPYGATEAAQNAADIVLMESGLKYLCEAVLTSRSITVRMKSCMVHAVSIAIHNVLDFMLLTLVWKFDFPPFKMLIIALANCFINVIASQNRVKSTPLPVNWSLSEILTTGIVLGSYLAMSTVIFFWAVYETNFFSLEKTYMKFVLAVLLQVSNSNYVLIFVMRTGRLLPGCDSLLFICLINFFPPCLLCLEIRALAGVVQEKSGYTT
ncbi:hypothetical protein H5410_009464 [Solanum commersonii]|uniref:Cation-transporting P-type ATPase N-terminal domain-containing protein n=1 Tax=Solanum commersonii TaxID=4109 RepID=A0A9J6AHZ4_SOLCO|nr:hypothetical protein H5410_009464 [Solanum commersonii]